MDLDSLIPITLFLCITYAIKFVVDARFRSKLIQQGSGSEELIRSLVQGDDQRRRHASLRWGVLALTLAVAFGLIEAFGWREVTPGVIALLLAATGLGNLAYYALSRRLS
ncbi:MULTISPECIES: DUF6249 domain-containing protein [unclassified Lysobacter]|uniref:DUF6249 domain-containing protein n=1 Tax=unclassified Lysobacter TaxID=2635362 RepID=UPI0006F29758|nr:MULTISPECIES: DUF6249 domain-containing protein [unclassified Lysobacter]KRA16272.1 hypothetical protein ASD69_16255 [Lysobacter sp. Root604]KRD31972.1 hypothetical protein ASE35_13500 [Lysobacter sp. Root916]KRD75841.1 hypothetical protein ASE43_13485 [Lysobacter sp. Root983]